MTVAPEACFSPDYATARDRFRQAVERAGGRLDALPLTVKGPDGGALSIDTAWFGPESARKALVHSSGLHGVEGFAGSAVQLRIIENLPPLPDETAVLFTHVINPYGMAWLRRFNENNVDLNRNFLPDGERYEGHPEGYEKLYAFLNPSRLPRIDLFVLRAAWWILRFGRPTMKAAVVTGQYDYPEGIFFGGNELQEGARLYRDFLMRRVSGAERLFGIDVHTGLGPFGEDTVLVGENDYERLHALLGERVQAFREDAGKVAYRIRGGHHEIVPLIARGAHVDFVGQEFGTHGNVRVLNALRRENWAHQHAERSIENPFKRRLRDVFYPQSATWQEKVLKRGRELFVQALSILGDER